MSQSNWFKHSVVFAIAANLTLTYSATSYAADLGFSPQRVLMGPRDRSASLRLTNRGKSFASYRISMVDVVYRKDGRILNTKRVPPGFPSAKRFIRFSPRQVRLGPGQSQTVRVLLRRAHKLADGEYRVHALLSRLPNVAGVRNPAARAKVASGVVGVSQAVALPIIVRRGRTKATGRLQSVRIKRGRAPRLDVQMARRGNQSLYTDLRLRDRSGKVVKVVKGIAVPVPNQTRRYFFPLSGVRLRKDYVLDMVDHRSGKVYSSVKFR